MIFKTADAQAEYERAPKKLKEIAEFIEFCSLRWGIEPVVTRVRAVIEGSSGVHEAGRALDFRDETRDAEGHSSFVFPDGAIEQLLHDVNSQFPRDDGKLVLIHHSFRGGPYHLHCQIPAAWLEKGEPV